MKKIVSMLVLKLTWIFGISFFVSFLWFQLIERMSKHFVFDGFFWFLYESLVACAALICFGVQVGLVAGNVFDKFYLTPNAILVFLFVLPCFQNYLGTLLLAIFWVAADLKHCDGLDEIKYAFRQISRNKAKKKEEAERQKVIIEKCGEDGIDLYENTLEKISELIEFYKDIGLNYSIWKKIQDFLKANPERVKLVSGMFDISVNVALDVYHELPRNINGNIDNNFRSIPKTREVLIQVSNAVDKKFEHMLKMCSIEIDASLRVIEKTLEGNSL